MLRTILFYTVFLGLTPLYCTVFLLLAPFKLERHIAAAWCRLALWSAGVKMNVDLSNVPKEGPLVFVANHQSQFDIPIVTLALAAYYPAFMAKKSLFKLPLLGWCFTAGGHIPVDRKNKRSAMKSLDDAVDVAKNGRSILIYPEGTRQLQTDTLGEFKTGGIIIALKTGLPVVPMVLEGSGEILPKGNILLKPRHEIRLRSLPPIETKDISLKERNQFRDDLWNTMNDAYQEMRECRQNNG